MDKPKAPKRILLKVSGESISGDLKFGIDQDACIGLAHSIKTASDAGLEIAVVIGGGNIFRGIHLKQIGLERTPADHMGMLATIMNGIALQQALNKIGADAKVLSALECPRVAETYNWQLANNYLNGKHPLIFVGGTGNPYFTTDTAAALRASEIEAEYLLKATKVAGVYDKDPIQYSDAKKFEQISYANYLSDNLQVMDVTAVSLCMSTKTPIYVFSMELLKTINLVQIVSQQNEGTIIHE